MMLFYPHLNRSVADPRFYNNVKCVMHLHVLVRMDDYGCVYLNPLYFEAWPLKFRGTLIPILNWMLTHFGMT